MRQRHVGDARIEQLHDRGSRNRESNDPRINRRTPFGGPIHGDRSSAHSYLNLSDLSIQSLNDSMSLFNPHLRHHRHPRTQFMPLVLARLEHDLHRYALYNFDVVAGRVFGWQQAEARSTGAGDGIDMPLVSLAGRIDSDLSRQPRLHLLKLRLFEVSCDPQVRVIARNHLHPFLPRLPVLTNLDGPVSDGSADRLD